MMPEPTPPPVNPPPGTDPTGYPLPPQPGDPGTPTPAKEPAKVNYLANNGIPRRSRVDLWTPAESAINSVAQQVESLGAHPRLTDAVISLAAARDAVADWAEETGNVRPEPAKKPADAPKA